jgi:hypothetical protein
MLVLSGILEATNYANQDYACQLHAYSCLHNALSNQQPIKKRLMFLPGYGSIAIADHADWSIIVQ